MKAGVIGSPISHSLSPFIFEFLAQHENVLIDYQSFEIKKEVGLDFLKKLKSQNDYLGLNVTLPLKDLFLEQVDYLSEEVSALGALNVLSFKAGKISGYNTDIVGIKKTLEHCQFNVLKKDCFLLGAGGAAKAVAFVLGSLGAKKVIIFNRSKNKSDEMVFKFSSLFKKTQWLSISSFEDQELKASNLDLIINSTSVGMTGKDGGEDFYQSIENCRFNHQALAFDLIYTPWCSAFLKKAKLLGLKTTNGLGMLIDQALATWKIWIGELSDEKKIHLLLVDLLKGVLALRADTRPLYLSGFMGVGKSSVALELAKLLKWEALDTDHLIEEKNGLKIPEIFESIGELGFRKLEQEIILDIVSLKKTVVSLGGGALTNDVSLDKILNSGALIYLMAEEKTLLERISNKNQIRPILHNLSIEEKKKKILDLLMIRKKQYIMAPIQISTDLLQPKEVAYEIIKEIGKKVKEERES